MRVISSLHACMQHLYIMHFCLLGYISTLFITCQLLHISLVAVVSVSYTKMSVDVLLTAKDIVVWITNRLDQLKLSEDTAIKVKGKLESFEKIIKKIEPHLKQDDDIEEIKQFLDHLEKAYQLCADILEKHVITRLAISPTADISKLDNIQAEIEKASSKLQLFITSRHLSAFCEAADEQNQMLAKISALQENSKAGVHIVQDNSVTLPSAPLRLTLHEDKNKLVLSWEPSEGIVDEYEVCYDEHNECIIPVGITTAVKLESPNVQPGNVYAMKVRGINKGGKGEWSNVVTGQITKPSPQKPEISNLLLRSTMTTVTVKVAEPICSTESPVTCVEVSYASTASAIFTNCEFPIQPGNATGTFTVSALQPNSKYKFTVKAKNAEGWSRPSDPRGGSTLSLPPLPAKPSPPVIKVCTPTVKLEVIAPENTSSISSPIVAWRALGYSESNEEVDKYYTQDEMDFMGKCSSLDMADVHPNQEYTLKLFAKNENGWSVPSEAFKIHIAMPPPPENVRVSSYRTHSLVKIRWNAPDSSILVTQYEIAKTTRQGDYGNYKQPIVVPANKFSATFAQLWQRTQYYFKVRACNDLFTSVWSNEIEAKTRMHKKIKAAISPVIWAFGTVTAPFSTAVKAGGLAGKSINKGGSNKTTVAAGTAGGAVGGLVAGSVGAPVVGAVMAHYFVNGMDALSDQSDDEDAVVIEDY